MLSQRKYYIQSCYRNENIIFSRAIATKILYSVVLSQRQVFNQKDEVRMQYLFVELLLLPERILQNPKVIIRNKGCDREIKYVVE